MARWISVTRPFDYHWPDRSAVTHFSLADLGDKFVKDDLADFAVAGGHATEGKSDEASRSTKGTGARKRAKKGSRNATTADSGTVAPVGDENAADADRTADRPPVDPDAQ